MAWVKKVQAPDSCGFYAIGEFPPDYFIEVYSEEDPVGAMRKKLDKLCSQNKPGLLAAVINEQEQIAAKEILMEYGFIPIRTFINTNYNVSGHVTTLLVRFAQDFCKRYDGNGIGPKFRGSTFDEELADKVNEMDSGHRGGLIRVSHKDSLVGPSVIKRQKRRSSISKTVTKR